MKLVLFSCKNNLTGISELPVQKIINEQRGSFTAGIEQNVMHLLP